LTPLLQIPSKYRPFIESPRTHNVFEGGRGGSKTRTISGLLVEVMNQAPVKIICGREIQKSLKESSYLSIKQEIYRLGYGDRFKLKENDGVIESHTGARAVFIGLQQHTVDSIKSYESFNWAWIEEAQSVSKQSLETLIPTLRTDGAFYIKLGEKDHAFPLRMFMYTMNPYSWDDPINLVLPESRGDVRRIRVNYPDNPWFPDVLEDERKEAERIMSAEEYARIWRGIPYDNAERAIMPRAAVMAAMKRKVSTDGGIVVGADIARFGDDATVFVKRQGLQVTAIETMYKQDTQEVASRLFTFAEGGKINVDDTGVGGGVTDRLRRMGANVCPVNFGAAPIDKKKYPDIISEMWFNLAELLPTIGLKEDNELLAELASRQFRYTPDERRKVESKEEYKKRTGRHSPDRGDSAILCFYQPRTVRAGPSASRLGL
jgi:PBSX family phage terminase large subunit